MSLSKFELKLAGLAAVPGEDEKGLGNALEPLNSSVGQQRVKDVCLEISNSVHMTKTQVLPSTHSCPVYEIFKRPKSSHPP